MNYTEYSAVSTKSYIDYCNYLLKKYGAVDGDYFSANFTPNANIKRREENLFVHHMREDKVANLSDINVARANDFEHQKAHNLVYANLLEHILLHIMIGEQNYTLGFGGAELMISQANDYISNEEDYTIVLETLKERLRNDLSSCETLLQHNATVFYELDDTLSKHDRALVVIGTGLGKTTTALAYIRKYGMRGLVLGPNRVITDAWEKNEDVDAYTYQWFMSNYKTIDYSKYGVMICDEAHHCAAPKWGEGIRYALDNQLVKVIGLTATPKEDKKDKANYEKSTNFFAGCVCKGFSVLDGIEREIIHDFSYVGAIYDTSGIKEKYADISDKTLLGELDLALNNTPTVKTIITKHMPNNKRKGIIFVSNIDAMGEAEDIMRDIYPNAEYRRMHSRMSYNEVEETREWFQNTDEGYLLAVNMISEGAHYKGINTIIMFRRTQSSLVFHQQLGRIITLARDEDPHAIVFDLVNNAENLDTEKGFSASLRESYAQRKTRGGKEKSEQVIVKDYAEAISDVLRKITEIGQKRAVICIETQITYSGINEAGRLTGIHPMNISGACRGLRITAGKYHWAYIDDETKIQELSCFIGCGPAKKIAPGKYKPVICIETGITYESCQAADEAIGASRGKVSAACTGAQETVRGYHWCFLDDTERYNTLKHFSGMGKTLTTQPRQVYCIETKEIFSSIAEAKRQKRCNNIEKCLSGERQKAGGYHWKYVE